MVRLVHYTSACDLIHTGVQGMAPLELYGDLESDDVYLTLKSLSLPIRINIVLLETTV